MTLRCTVLAHWQLLHGRICNNAGKSLSYSCPFCCIGVLWLPNEVHLHFALVGRADESNKIMYPLVPVPLPALKFITITKFHVLAVWIMTPLMDTYTCISTVLTPCRGGSARISYWAGMESAGAPYSRPRPSSGSSSDATSWILHRDQYILLCVII